MHKPLPKHTNPYHRWELLTCAFNGHETYQPIGSKAAEKLAVQLKSSTERGEAWQCLRCGVYVLGPPKYRSKLADAPLVRRGKLLRQVVILRLLAFERLFRALLLLVLAYAITRFKSNQGSLSKLLDQDLPGLRSVSNSIGYNIDNSAPLRLIHEALKAKPHTLTLLVIGVIVYAGLQITEGIGLWLIKRWGEYFAVVATSLFLPLEIYELADHLTILKALTFAINLGAVLYLLLSKRLFRIRGGKEAYEQELQTDNLAELTSAGANKT